MKLSSVQKAFVALIAANIIWGAAAPIFKLSLQNIPPFTLAFWRFFLGSIILLSILGKRAKLPTKNKKDLTALVWYALTGITINIMFFFWGLQLTYSINSPVIASAQPILTAAFAFVFLHERFSWRKISGMLLGVVGIIVIVFEPLMAQGIDGSVIGNLFLVVATVAAVLQTVIGKSVIKKFDPLAFTFWAFVIGWASFLPLAALEYTKQPLLYMHLDWRGIVGVLYGAIFSSATAYSLYAWALTRISATDTAIFTYVDPIMGTILGALLLHESITVAFTGGAAFIFSGIFVAEGRLHYHPLHLFRQLPTLRTVPPPPMSHAPPPEAFTTPRTSSMIQELKHRIKKNLSEPL